MATPSSSTGTASSTRTRGRTIDRARPSRNGRNTSPAARSAGRSCGRKLFFFGDYQGSRQDAPGFGTASVAPEAWRRGDLSSVAVTIRDPQPGSPFTGNQIPVDAASVPWREPSSMTWPAIRCRTGPCRASRGTSSARRRSQYAHTRGTPVSTGTRRRTTSSSCATPSPPTLTRATRSPSRSSSRRATTSRSGTWAATGTASSGHRS